MKQVEVNQNLIPQYLYIFIPVITLLVTLFYMFNSVNQFNLGYIFIGIIAGILFHLFT